MKPRIVVPADTWHVIVDELDRVAPREGVVLPLVSLVRNAGAAHPCTTTLLEQLDGVVLAHAIPVPSLLQRNTSVHVSALPGADAWLDARVDAAVRAWPALRTAAYLHSHPFATGDTRPSGTDVEGHMRPMLQRKMEEGLHVAFSFIACRLMGAERWRLRAFACTPGQNVVDIGAAETVDPLHPWVQLARLPHARHRGLRGSIRRWRRAAFEAGFPVRVDDLFDGWVRLRLEAAARRTLVVLLAHATARAEHVLWLDGENAPVAWDHDEGAHALVQRVRVFARAAA